MLAPIYPKSTELTTRLLDFMLMGLCVWSRFGSFFGCWLTKVSGYNLDKGRHHVFGRKFVKEQALCLQHKFYGFICLGPRFLSVGREEEHARGKAEIRVCHVINFGIKAGECTGRLLLEEDSSVEDKSTVEPPTLCWLISGPVAEN